MFDTQPVTTARHPRVMDSVIVWGERGTIVNKDSKQVLIRCQGAHSFAPIDRLRWTGTAWVIIPEHAA